MDDAETQYLGQYIVNGVFNEVQLAYNISTSSEYKDNFLVPYYSGSIWNDYDLLAASENALGRLPTAEEMATFGAYNTSDDPFSFAVAAAAVAQYAMN